MTKHQRLQSQGQSLETEHKEPTEEGEKLEASFLGPYTIMAIEGKNADFQDENGAVKVLRKINIDQLKFNIEDTPRVPHWDIQQVDPNMVLENEVQWSYFNM